MRLWHEKLIPLLPRQQLLGQHRECCALRGNGWGKKHATVDYVFKHPYVFLFAYHIKVMYEMESRGYNVDKKWQCSKYRGKNCDALTEYEAHIVFEGCKEKMLHFIYKGECIYPEHDEAYLQECIDNLAGKGIVINREDING